MASVPTRRAVATLLAFAALPLTLPASAFHNPYDAAVFVNHSFSGPGWAAYRFHTTGSTELQVETISTGGVGPVADGFALYDAGGALVAGGVGIASGGAFHVRVASELAGVDVRQGGLAASGGGEGTIEYTCSYACFVGEHTLVLYAAGAGSSTATVRIDGATLLASTSGTDAFLYAHHEFDGPAVADASLLVGNAYAGVAAERTVTATGRLVGAFVEFQYMVPAAMEVDAPSGTRACTCMMGGPADGPGAYTFRYTTASTEYGIWLVGADVTMPA